MTYSVRNIAIAVVMAVAAAAAVLVYTTSYRQSVTRGQKRVEVMVATRDIPAGTPAEQAIGAMQLSSVLVDDRAPGAVSTTGGLSGKVAAQTIFQGQQVISASFQASNTQAAALRITKTERAIRINVDPASGVLGAIHAGDKVDVFATITIKDGESGSATTAAGATGAGATGAGATETHSALNTGTDRIFTRRLLTNVLVLEVPEETGKKGGLGSSNAGGKAAQVMLSVSQKDATKLAFVNSIDDGKHIWLVVRPPDAQAEDQPLTIETIESIITDGVSPAELKTKYQQSLKLLYSGR